MHVCVRESACACVHTHAYMCWRMHACNAGLPQERSKADQEAFEMALAKAEAEAAAAEEHQQEQSWTPNEAQQAQANASQPSRERMESKAAAKSNGNKAKTSREISGAGDRHDENTEHISKYMPKKHVRTHVKMHA